MPISPSLKTFKKKGSAAKEMVLQTEPVMVYMPACLKESLSKMDFIF